MNLTKLSKILILLTSVLWSATIAAQSISVSGTVTEASSGLPSLGAAVMVKGTTVGVVTDIDGKYTIQAQPKDVLIFQSFGFKTVEMPVNGRAVIDIALEEDAVMLDATVVVGYGTLKKTQLVGAVENINGEELENRTNTTVARSLQGQVAGLNIIQSDGKPNHSGSIYVRGGKTSFKTRASMGGAGEGSHSIGQGGSALILIDGVEGSLTSVNPDDIESISVLKDASSAAVYGARGAFGVILVTTKTPKGEKVSVSYQGSVAVNQRTVIWEDNIVTDGLQWAEGFYEFYTNTARTPASTGKTPTAMNQFSIPSDYLESFRQHRESGSKEEVVIGPDGNYRYYASTNWLEKMYKKANLTHSHSLSISGSTKRFSFRITGRYYGQDGIYKVGEENFHRYNFRAKIGVNVTDWLSFDSNTYFYRNIYNQPFVTTSSTIPSSIQYYGFPIFPVYNPDGSYTAGAARGGYALFNENKALQQNNNLSFAETIGMDIKIIKDVLKLHADFTYKVHRNGILRYRGQNMYSLAPGSVIYDTPQESTYKSVWKTNNDILNANAILTWTPKLGDNHDLNVVAGWNIEDYKREYYYITRKGLLYDGLPNFELMDDGGSEFTTITLSDNDGNASYGLIGIFGRINYTLLRRYIFEFSSRYDGSSKFPTNQKWGFFPSGSFGWRVSEEPWMKWSRDVVDNFKLRGNYGALGNANISAYQYLETIGIGKSGVLFNGSKVPVAGTPTNVPDGLTWEKVYTWDVGMDLDLLNSRLSFSGDFYVRDTKDLYITGTELPAIYGASAPKGNYGALRTRGWELTVSWRDQFDLGGKPFSYSAKASLWDSRTWVAAYNNISGDILGYYEGKELGEIWGFRTDGYFLSNAEANNWAKDTYHKNGDNFQAYAGDLKFIDVNGDGEIGVGKGTLEDHGDLERIGNVTPRYQFGLNLDFRWNNIGLSLFFQGLGKRDWYPACESGFFWGMYNRPYTYLMNDQTGDNYVHIDYSTDNWVVTNADKKPYWTRRVGYSANRNVGPLTWENDYYLQNAAYFRLKNLTIDYSLPKHIIEKAKIENVKIYLAMENLLTWSPIQKYTKMFDPEVIDSGDSDFSTSRGLNGQGDGFSYPMLRSFTFGVNLTF